MADDGERVEGMTIGYIVIGHRQGVMTLCSYRAGEPLVLAFGDDATLFESYEAARSAVRRTQRYAAKHGLLWGDRKKIVQVRRDGDSA